MSGFDNEVMFSIGISGISGGGETAASFVLVT
jgi:hypothetical protein